MRTKVIAGNWKMYKTNPEAKQLVETLKSKTEGIKKTRIIVCPPAPALALVCDTLRDSEIAVGAQNMHWEAQGAFTGEISAEMIKSTGTTYVILGHSERRQYFGETDETVNKKLIAAIKANLNPIVCLGETLQEREQGITNQVVERQVQGALAGIAAQQVTSLIIAYEPVWAIGTGKTATPDQAQEVHALIRLKIETIYDRATSEALIIQYGGSVKPNNAHDLLQQPDLDGALVGGACLDADSFTQIITAAEKLL
jgi:triosephosphate isomerase